VRRDLRTCSIILEMRTDLRLAGGGELSTVGFLSSGEMTDSSREMVFYFLAVNR